MQEMNCCFTGHRTIDRKRLPEVQRKLLSVLGTLYDQGFRQFYCGGAQGFDLMAGEAVIMLKRNAPDMRLIMVLPCREQAERFNKMDQARHARLCDLAAECIYVSEQYTPSCMHERNRYLVNNSSVCIAYLTSTRGGTKYTVNYANQSGVKVINLAQE